MATNKEKTGKARNRYAFGLGTVGRDMAYSMVSMYLIFYLTDVIELPTATMWWASAVILLVRIFDAVNDPFMGVIVDNTHSKWGRFKPWIASGAVVSAVFTVLFFTDFGLTGAAYVISFTAIYLLWEISFTANDIAYWSMLPTLSLDQKEREKIGSVARICANVGLFFVVAAIVPLTKALGGMFGSLQMGYFAFAVIVVAVMVLGQCFTLFGVRETREISEQKEKTSVKDMLSIIFKNDQLLFTALAMSLFMIGYMTTTSFGLYFFKYAYGNEDMYSIFALILGVSQITALAVFPLFSKRFERKTLYSAATALVVAGYLIFFFAPTTTMLFIGIAGVLIFVGQAFIQLMMLMFLADSVDYGHLKLGKRNDSVSFSIQPFINKMGGAVASGIVSVVIIVSGIKDAGSAAEVTKGGLLMMKSAMLFFPLVCVVISYIVYRAKYKIDGKMHAEILTKLREKGEISDISK